MGYHWKWWWMEVCLGDEWPYEVPQPNMKEACELEK